MTRHYSRNKLNLRSKQKRNLTILILSLFLPIATLSTTLFLTRAREESVVPTESSANESSSWQIVQTMPEMSYGQSLLEYNGKLYLFGSVDNQWCGSPNRNQNQSTGISYVRTFDGSNLSGAFPYMPRGLGGVKTPGHVIAPLTMSKQSTKTAVVLNDQIFFIQGFWMSKSCGRYTKRLVAMDPNTLAVTAMGGNIDTAGNDATIEVIQNSNKSEDPLVAFTGDDSQNANSRNIDIVSPYAVEEFEGNNLKENPEPWFRDGSLNAQKYDSVKMQDGNSKQMGMVIDNLLTSSYIVPQGNSVVHVASKVGDNIYFGRSRDKANGDLSYSSKNSPIISTINGTNDTTPTLLTHDAQTNTLYVAGYSQVNGDLAKAKGTLYAVNLLNNTLLNNPFDIAPFTQSSQGINPSAMIKYGNKLFIANKYSTVQSSIGVSECTLKPSGGIEKCDPFKPVPGLIGGDTGMRGGMNSFAILNNELYGIGHSNGNGALFKYTGNTGGGIGNGVGQPQAPVPSTAPALPVKPTTGNKGSTAPAQCTNDAEASLGSKEITRYSCNIDLSTGSIDTSTCTKNADLTLRNQYAGADAKTPGADNKLWQTYLTRPMADGQQLRCYRMCDFNPQQGKLISCPEQFSCRSVNNIEGTCTKRYNTYSSYELQVDNKNFTVMSYLSTNQTDLVAQICEFNPSTGDVLDYNKCITGRLDISNLRGVGNEKYKSYSSFMLDSKKLVQYYLSTENKYYQRVCDISYSIKAGGKGLDLKADSCQPFVELNLKDQEGKALVDAGTQFVTSLEPYTRDDGSVRVSFYVYRIPN